MQQAPVGASVSGQSDVHSVALAIVADSTQNDPKGKQAGRRNDPPTSRIGAIANASAGVAASSSRSSTSLGITTARTGVRAASERACRKNQTRSTC